MLQPGTQIGRYEIQRRLGRGGMGTVYAAHDPVLGRMVAVKVFLGDLELPNAADRFSREARSAAALNHANIVTVHDFGDYEGQPYIVMEYVQGETLSAIIRRKAAVSLVEKLRWIEELCGGVAYAHHLGVIHRDIKPTNLMVDRSGRLKVLDFGIARMLGTLGSSATALIGTPGYMAPEQIRGGAIDLRSDVFSIGVVAYELLSYAEAFPGDSLPAITHRVLSDHPPPLSELAPDISPELSKIVERALNKTPTERFDDVESMGTAIRKVHRQVMEEQVSSDVTVMSPRAGQYSAPTGKPGAAPSSRPTPAGPVAITPPPPRGSREELARRRTSQIETSIEQARALLSQGNLDGALDACEQALTFDEEHPGALQLEQVIRAAVASRRAGVLLEEAKTELERGALTVAQDLLQQARVLDPETPGAKRIERDLRLARVEQERVRRIAEQMTAAIESGSAALARGEVEAALALAREALALQNDSERARALEREAMRRLDEETEFSPALETPPTIISSPAPATVVSGPVTTASQPVPVVPPAPRVAVPAASGPVAPAPAGHAKTETLKRVAGKPAAVPDWRVLQARVTNALQALQGVAGGATKRLTTLSKRDRMIATGVAAAAIVVLAGVGIAINMAGPVPTGSVVIDAVPWATVTAIEAEDGTRLTLPSPAATPLALDVPAGNYRITLAGPSGDADARVISISVAVGALVATPVERFVTLTPDEYFGQYLTAPGPVPPPDAAAGATVAVEQTPTPEVAP